jgi:predicted amidohydrolase YtcJ
MKLLVPLLIITLLSACQNKIQVDLIVKNANIYTVDSTFSQSESFAISNGEFLSIGSNQDIQSNYTSDNIINVNGKTIIPGIIDAHCHFINYAELLLNVDLTGTSSFKEIIKKCEDFDLKSEWLIGRGWDQNDWDNKSFPNKELLDQAFPNTPVYLTRIDGHAAIANSKALSLSGITISSKVNGGKVIIENGDVSGVLIDNAMNLVKSVIPKTNPETLKSALLKAQGNLFSHGITSIHDAGLEYEQILFLKELYESGELKIKTYAMMNPSENNFKFHKELNTHDKLIVKSVKLYADGALGSRGALLTSPYSDDSSNTGLLLSKTSVLDSIISFCYENNLQVNTHSIGDSSAKLALELYSNHLKKDNNRRWRIEHAQVINPKEYHYFQDYNILPSVQPTHTTSDMPWAEDRLGHHRISWAYSYKTLYDINHVIPLGTDFPIESINPFFTFHSATTRSNREGHPSNGWQSNEKLSKEETLKGMTWDAAYASFRENRTGSIEIGKDGDFTILDRNIMSENSVQSHKAFSIETYIDGERVYNLYPVNY